MNETKVETLEFAPLPIPRQRDSRKTADITAKKMKKPLYGKNPLISAVSTVKFPGTTDITAKKKIKNLTFDFCCANKDIMIGANVKRNWLYRRYRCHF